VVECLLIKLLGYVLAPGILTSTVAILVFHLVWEVPVSYVSYPREEIRQVFVTVCKSVPNPVALLPAMYKVRVILIKKKKEN
jgi:hypothetical protein